MKPLTPSSLVATAAAFAGLREQGGNNRGLMIELMLRNVGLQPGQPWCAAFVHHVGFWSHYDHALRKSRWPLPATGSCWFLGRFARSKGILCDCPQVGDVFLVWNAELERFSHTGVIAHVREVEEKSSFCDTIEGNTNQEGSRDGGGVMTRERHFGPDDRFVRWVDLDDSPQALLARNSSMSAKRAA